MEKRCLMYNSYKHNALSHSLSTLANTYCISLMYIMQYITRNNIPFGYNVYSMKWGYRVPKQNESSILGGGGMMKRYVSLLGSDCCGYAAPLVWLLSVLMAVASLQSLLFTPCVCQRVSQSPLFTPIDMLGSVSWRGRALVPVCDTRGRVTEVHIRPTHAS